MKSTVVQKKWLAELSTRLRSCMFQLCGYTGFLLGFVQSVLLVKHLGLSQLTLLGITGTVILTFYVLMMVTKILADGEVIIYYHHEIAVIATSALFLWLTRQPVLPYLDVLVLGLGLFLTSGRIGCFMVGCCHGRPSRWGVRYGESHAQAGFPRYLVGVKLFPIQAIESVVAFCIVGCGLFLILKVHEPGSVFLFYVISYGCGRFSIEFFRGDAARRYLCGFSEAQWTSLLLALAALCAEYARILPRSMWHSSAAIAMVTCIVLVSARRHFDDSRRFQLLHPAHVQEISFALSHLKFLEREEPKSEASGSTEVIHVVHTSAGYRISGGGHTVGPSIVEHFSISGEGSVLSPRVARRFSELLAGLSGHPGSFDLIQGSTGVFHILFVRSSALAS
jgi:hypothetical protein